MGELVDYVNYLLVALPLLPSVACLLKLDDEESSVVILWSILISVLGFLLTDGLIPVFAQYTLKRGLSGKDMGKRGTALESTDVPEALGLVCGIVFLISTISAQLLFARNEKQMIVYNSALFSVCFMIFLGFLDDTLDLKWRYKLILPTVSSLPLLLSYSGSTAMYIAKPLRVIFMSGGELTWLGRAVDVFATVDTEAHGAIVELGSFFLLFMGLQAVFCTNAINIFAGINGLECGQAYVIACSILFFKMYEITHISGGLGGLGGEGGDRYAGSRFADDSRFAIVLVLPFIGTSLALLRHNWFPASVFVGDTYCYFAGMTFAVIGIHSHFSKTLLMLFVPQILNFLYSTPQLFKLAPCPRHRLPRIHAGLMTYSAFPCKEGEFRWLKVAADDKECPNLTIICGLLRLTGPLKERTLCILLLSIQGLFSALAFYVRYFLLED